MTARRTILGLTAILALFVVLSAPLSRAMGDVLVFGDGFTIEGRVREKMDFIFDHGSGQALAVPKSGQPFWLDDNVRNIYFPPGQIKEALKDRAKKEGEVSIKQTSPLSQGPLLLPGNFDTASSWNERMERELILKTPQGGKMKVGQRITLITPERIRVESTTHEWQSNYYTREFDPQTLRSLLYQYFTKKKEKDYDLRVKVQRFLFQAGFAQLAEQEVDDLLRDYPKEQSQLSPLKDTFKRLRAAELVLSLERSMKAGLHDDVEKKLDLYAKQRLDDLLEESAQLRVQAVKDKYEAFKKKMTDAESLLRAFADITPPSQRAFFQKAAATIVGELSADTVDRLDLFVNLAADYERAIKDKRQPEQTAAEVMAFALTGWLRGGDAGERDPKVAMQQWEARQHLLDYLRTDNLLVRKNKHLAALKAASVSVDEAMQIIRRLPPADPFEKVSTKPQILQTKNNGKQFSYALQLPPGYNHGRAWPVLIALHHSEEKPAEAAARWAVPAAEHGYIVAAPEWGKGPKAVYQYSSQEHDAVLETLRDLRRRFQIDSDRVFLFGGEQGGVMAFDVGFAHPDQFTGVVPMAAPPLYFARRCWPNAQFLHLYIVNGERTGYSLMDKQGMFREFIRCNFPAIYVEYKGRPPEWFGAEQPIIFDWMNRKRRANPLKELGRKDEDFRTQRESDNQFYWLSTQAVHPAYLNSAGAGWNNNIKSATMRATIFSTNEIHIKTSGVGRMTLWFAPKMVNYGEKVSVRLNDSTPTKYTVTPALDTLLETLYQTGDRQRLYFAKLDL